MSQKRCGMMTIKNKNLSLLSRSFYKKISSLIVMPRLKKVARVSWCSTFSWSSWGICFWRIWRIHDHHEWQTVINKSSCSIIFIRSPLLKRSFQHTSFSRKKKQICPKWSRVYSHWNVNVLFMHKLRIVKK